MNTQVKTRRGGVQSCIFGNMFDEKKTHFLTQILDCGKFMKNEGLCAQT